ncbi:hypothetical protein ACFO0N_18230 [Halobium salinum]|uniref:Rpa-associated protein n=1 Tax=Halobium salinum TaxID=1364940 RepID=A0ABD5PGM8_9EURY|nr:hypothetical protein [Halobium salinum]
MSGSNSDSNSNDSSDAGPGSREVAQRLFAAEFDDATFSYSESDEERAPNYVVSPTGARINRMFAVGVLTEVESVNEDIVRGRVVDATGPFVTYAGQYQPDEQAYLERTTPPAFVALTGKARTFQPEDSDRIYTSVRPESLNSVDAETRDRWLVTTAESTLHRLAVMRDAVASDLRGDDLRDALEAAGVQSSLATGVPYAIDHYGTTTAYLEAVRQLAVDALEVVAGERDEVRGLNVAPDEGGSADLGALPEGVDLDAAAAEPSSAEDADEPAAAGAADAASTGALVDEDESTAAEPAEAATPESSDPETTTGGADASGSADASDATDTDGPATADATSAASTGSTLDADAAGDETAAEPAEATGTDEATPTETVADEPAADTSAADSASGDASSAASTGSTVDTESGAAEPAEAADPGAASDDLGDFDAGADAGDGSESEPAAARADDAASTGSLVDEDESTAAEPAEAAETAGSDDDGMYELDDDERREVEAEFGTEFSTGNDVADPGEADIDVPDADDLTEEADGGDGDEDEKAATGGTSSAASTGSTVDAEAASADADAAAEPAEATDATGDGDLGDFDAGSEDSGADTDTATAETDEADAEGTPDAADVDLESTAVDIMDELDDGDGAARENVVAALVERYGADPEDADDAIQDALMSGKCYEPGEDSLKAI